MSKEKTVRDAAAALLTAIHDARKTGLSVEWPGKPEGLATIAISATGAAQPDESKKQSASKK